MTNIATALNKLGVDGWVLNGDPTNENEFNKMFRKVTGEDTNGTAIESDNPNDFGVTWDQIVEKQTELQAEYETNQYQRDRAEAYPELKEQLDLLWHAIDDGKFNVKSKETDFYKKLKAVKDANPKPE